MPAHDGRHVVIATGTASGKSLAYQLPAVDAVHRAELRVLENPGKFDPDGAVTLYLSPTKALAADQLAALHSLHLPTLRAATYDGDTDPGDRRWIRDHANFVLCNPDMLHFGVLPNHTWWARFFRRLKYVMIDEAHSYRGVFGSHVANLMRRLRRICAHYGANPVFIARVRHLLRPGDVLFPADWRPASRPSPRTVPRTAPPRWRSGNRS